MRPGILQKIGENISGAISSGREKLSEYSEDVRGAAHDVVDLPWSIGDRIDSVSTAIVTPIKDRLDKEVRVSSIREDLLLPPENIGRENREEAQRYMLEEEIKRGSEIRSDKFSLKGAAKKLLGKLPFIDNAEEENLKKEVINDYRWLPHAVKGIMDFRIKDDFNVIEPSLFLKRGLPFGGMYRGNIKTIKITDPYTFITAHEFLHHTFRNSMTPASADPVGFNLMFENFRDYYGNDSEGFLADALRGIDSELKINVKLYKNIFKDDYRLANERFSFLGEMIGRRDWGGFVPEELARYYEDIFIGQKKVAPYKSLWAAQDSQAYNEYLKSISEY